MWTAEGFPIEPAFAQTTAADYGADASGLDFAGALPEAIEAIDAWVAEHTGGKITEYAAEIVDPDTVAFLANAIHFEATWQVPFDPDATGPRPFRAPSGSFDAPAMSSLGILDHYVDDDLAAIRIPYETAEIAMVVVLPHADDGVFAGDLPTWASCPSRPPACS